MYVSVAGKLHSNYPVLFYFLFKHTEGRQRTTNTIALAFAAYIKIAANTAAKFKTN